MLQRRRTRKSKKKSVDVDGSTGRWRSLLPSERVFFLGFGGGYVFDIFIVFEEMPEKSIASYIPCVRVYILRI